MNQQSIEKQPSLNLPPVRQETPVGKHEAGADSLQNVKQLGSERNPEFIAQGQSSSTPQPSAGSAVTPVEPAQTTTVSSTPATNDDTNPMIADDVDLIEKEWVEKAKKIVAQTKDDPYKQNEEINKVKADYIKKRYNKTIEANEDQPWWC